MNVKKLNEKEAKSLEFNIKTDGLFANMAQLLVFINSADEKRRKEIVKTTIQRLMHLQENYILIPRRLKRNCDNKVKCKNCGEWMLLNEYTAGRLEWECEKCGRIAMR